MASGFITLLAGVGILATDKSQADHSWGWALAAIGLAAMVVGGIVYVWLAGGNEGDASRVSADANDHSAAMAAGRDIKMRDFYAAPPQTEPTAMPNVVFDGYSHVRYQDVIPANISEDPRSEFARLRFVNEPVVRHPSANTDDLHATIEIWQGTDLVLKVDDGRWAENVDRGQAPARDTKSTALPCNGERRNLDVVMQRLGEDECYGWSHEGRKISKPPIPKGTYQVKVVLEASNMEQRTFLFDLVNHGKSDHLELREASDNPASSSWASRERTERPLMQEPKELFAIECTYESGIRLGNERQALAFLNVTYLGDDRAVNAYARVARITEHYTMNIDREDRPFRERRYRDSEVFLKWAASETRYHSFHTAAVLHVASGASGTGDYQLVTADTPGLFPSLTLFSSYEIDLEIAADNVPAFHRKLFLRMTERSYWNGPYGVEFRDWAESDQPEGESDIDDTRHR